MMTTDATDEARTDERALKEIARRLPELIALAAPLGSHRLDDLLEKTEALALDLLADRKLPLPN